MINRREFLGKLAGAGAGLAAAGLFTPLGMLETCAAGTGDKVKVTGGFARETAPGLLRVRALSLQPSFRIKFDSPADARLKVEIVNVWGERLKISGDGVGDETRGRMKISFELQPRDNGTAAVETEYTPGAGGNFDFIAFSDTHLGDPEAEQHFASVLKHVNVRRPVFAADAGDIIDVDEPKQWDVFEEKQALFETPLFTTIGNHDSYISTKLYREHLGDLFYGFFAGGSQFLFLDNAQRYNNATLYMTDGARNSQWDWLREQLALPAENRFVFFHFPVYGNRSMGDEMYMQTTPPEERNREIEEMIGLFRESGVDYLCFGHDHSPKREVRDGIVHLRLGGGGGSKASHTDDRNVNFAHIFVDEKGIRDYTVFTIFQDKEIEKIEFCEAPGRVAAGTQTPLIVHGLGGGRYLALEPEISVVSGAAGKIEGNILKAVSPGRVELQAVYAGMKATHNIEIVNKL